MFPSGNAACGSVTTGNAATFTDIAMRENGRASMQWLFYVDPVGFVAPSTTPGPVPTVPPNYWGCPGCTPPPANVNIDVNVSICREDGTIAACAHSFPPDLCVANPSIAACATFRPLASPPPGVGGGNGTPNGSPVPGGVEECESASHPPKVGTRPYESLAVGPVPAGAWDVGAYGAWIGTHVGNVPKVVGNAVTGINNTAIDALVPGECVGAVITSFADDVEGRVPFSWFAEVRDGLSSEGGEGVELGTVDLGPASVDLGGVLASAGGATSPYRSILGLLPWLLVALAIMRKVMGTVGAGEGGG